MTASSQPDRARLAVVLSHPTQYYSPWFRWIQAEGGLNLRVFYLWDAGVKLHRDPQFGRDLAWNVELCSGYLHEFVPNTARRPTTGRFFGLRNPGLLPRLEAFRPDALLIFGYAFASHLRVIAWAGRRRVPLIFRGDSHFLGRRPFQGLKGLVIRQVYRRFSAFTCTGVANRNYFESLGVPRDRLHFAPHSVDASRFDPSNRTMQRESADLRNRLQIDPDDRIVLFAGKFVPTKQPVELLEAFLALALPGTTLVMVGDGSERGTLETRLAAAGERSRRVRLLPFANQLEMPAVHLLASLFVLPSRGLHETWGLAVNEAMHMGVPCLVSNLVGCQQDLVVDGQTGWVFDASDRSALRQTLARALRELEQNRDRRRAAVLDRIAGYTYKQTTSGLQQALHTALNR